MSMATPFPRSTIPRHLIPCLESVALGATLVLALTAASYGQVHPRMFFSPDDTSALRTRATGEPYASMAAQIRRNILSVDYPLRGGNIATTYLLTGDETWAEMAAYRALDYISNTARWENNSASALSRAIDMSAVMMLYDFCYGSEFWSNFTVPATLPPKSFTVDGVTVQVPGDGVGTDATGRWHTSYTGRTISIPSKYVGLSLRSAISRALRNNADSLIASGGSGWPGNDATGSNWWAVRYAGAGLGYLACDESGTDTNLNTAITRLKTHLSANLGDSPVSMGWNPEGIAYAQFPGWFTYPFAIALQRLKGRNLVAEHPAMRYALWATYMGAVPVERRSRLGDPVTGTGLGIRPDFDDDHNVWEPEGTAALAFAFAYNNDPNDAIPDFDFRPGLKWLFNRLAGAKGDRLWDSASGNGIFALLYYPDAALPEQNPDVVWGRIYEDPSYGAYVFRSGHQDADFSNGGQGFATASTDIVTQTTVNLRPSNGGHSGPDALSLRVIGLGVPWLIGSGRIWSVPAQSSLMPYDPTTMGTGTLGVTPFGNEVIDSFLRRTAGDGYVIARQDTSDTGCANHTRRLVVDYSGVCGAPALILTYDTTDDLAAWWRINTFYGNTVDVSTPGQFTLTSPTGHRLVGRILYPANVTARTGEISRGNDYQYKNASYSKNRWVDFPLSADGHALVAMVIVPAGQSAPAINVSGNPTNGFTVTAGGASFTLQASSNTITSPYWNPPAVAISTPAAGASFYPAPASVTVSGTASDNGQIRRIDVYLDDVLRHSQNYSAANVNWGPFNLTDVAIGDHVVKVVATDDAGDTKAVTRAFRVTHSQPPLVSLTSPGSSSALFAGQTVAIHGRAADADGALNRVEIWWENPQNNPARQRLGVASVNTAEGTWSYLWSNLPVGRHRVWAIAYSEDGDVTESDAVTLKGSLFFSAVPTWGDAANYRQRADLNGAGRWSVVSEGGDLRLRVREMRNYDYSAHLNALLDTNNRAYPNFRLTYRYKVDAPLVDGPYFFTFFGQGDAGPVVFDAQTINSIEKQYSWTDVGRGTRVWYYGNSGYRPEIGWTYNIHLKSDPGYPNAPASDYAGIPNDGWNEMRVERIGKNLKVWVNNRQILDATHNYIGTRGSVGLGNERNTGFPVYFDDIDFTFLDANGNPVTNASATVTFNTPAAYADLVAGSPVALSGTVSDPEGIARLELFVGGLKIGEPTLVGQNWSFNWTPPIGRYALVLRVTDNAGFVTESEALRFKATATGGPGGNSAPSVTIAQDTGVAGVFALKGSATDSDGSVAGVQVLNNGTLVGTASVVGGIWTYNFGNLPAGTYAFQARVFDDLGASATSDTLNVTITEPTCSITAPSTGSSATVGIPAALEASASDPEGVFAVSFWEDGRKIGEASLVGAAWRLSWTPRFYGAKTITALATDRWGARTVSAPIVVNVVPDSGEYGSVVTYVGGAGRQTLLDALELSDGTILVSGIADDLNWTAAPKSQWTPPNGLPYGNTGRVAFLMRISADLQSILGIYHLPVGQVANLRWIKTTSKPGETTGAIYVSGQCNNSADGLYFIAKLNNNFVSGIPTGFAWAKTAISSNTRGDNLGLQTWDVGGDGRVVYVDETGEALRVFALDTNGNYLKLNQLRGSHWTGAPFDDATRQAGVGADLPGTVVSAVSFPADLRSWNDQDRLAVLSDGNGQIKRGRWPYDLFYPVQDRYGGTSGTIEYGYTGYKSAGRWRVGGIAVDRDTNDFYIGFNVQSRFWDSAANKEQPDFEPAVIAYSANGALKWWSRLYHEVVDANGNGVIDAGETRLSPPDQYVDGLALDYSVTPHRVVVAARAHGNASSNFWDGNALFANPGGNGFQNRFTGSQSNIHVSWIGKFDADNGNILRASWLTGYLRDTTLTQAPYSELIHDNWPSHNAGWANLTSTVITTGALRTDSQGRVYVAGWGPRMVTTFNAYQKLPKITPTVNEGIAPWNAFVRVYDANLATLVYSSALTGVWTYASPSSPPAGAENAEIYGVAPFNGGILAVGRHMATDGVALGNPVPVNKVPGWGVTTPNNETGLFARLLFATSANLPPTCALTQPSETVSVSPGGSVTLKADASDADGSVAQVAFYANGQLIFTDDTSPYEYTWFPPGGEGTTYTVQAIATDNRGAATASGTATVRVELVPTVQIISPSEGASLQANQPVNIHASATDTPPGYVTKVEFFVNNVKIGEDASAPYSFSWTPSAVGTHVIQARATDNDGAVGVSSPVSVYVTEANVPPTVSITQPVPNAEHNEAFPLNLTALATDGGVVASVEFFADGESIGFAARQEGDYWTLTWNPTRVGLVTFTARATDNQNAAALSAGVAVLVTSGNPPAAPSDLSAQALSWRRVALAWSDNSDNEVGFVVERKVGAGAWEVLTTVAADTNAYTDGSCSPSTAYAYRVKSVNLKGQSLYTNEAAVTTPAQNLTTYYWGTGAPPLTWNTTDPNWSATAGGAATVTFAGGDNSIADFSTQPSGNVTLTEDLLVYGIRNLRRQITTTANKTLQLGAGGITLNGTYGVNVPTTLVAAQTWSTVSSAQHWTGVGPFTGDRNVTLTWQPASGKGDFSNAGGNAWSNFVGRIRIVGGHDSNNIAKVENNGMTSGAIWELVNYGAFFNMRGTYTVAGLAGNGRVRADLASRTLIINTPADVAENFSGAIEVNSGYGVTIQKEGLGTQILSGNIAHTASNGAIFVNAGALLIRGTRTASGVSGKVIVKPTATLGGNGVIQGVVEVQPGAILSPGDGAAGVGALSLPGRTVLADRAVLEINLSPGAAQNCDTIAVGANGTLTLPQNGRVRVRLSSLGAPPAASDRFKLFDLAGATVENFDTCQWELDWGGQPWQGGRIVRSNHAIWLTNLRNTPYGIEIIEAGGATEVAEAAADVFDVFYVRLTSQPLSNVTLTLATDGQVTLDREVLVFTPSNWGLPQAVKVYAVNDSTLEGADAGGLHFGAVTFSAASADPNYHGVPLPRLDVQIYDDEFNAQPVVAIVTPARPDVYLSGVTAAKLVLEAEAVDQGVINPAWLNWVWSKQSGPGAVSFDGATNRTCTATFGAAGDYVLRATASDSSLSGYAELYVRVGNPPSEGPTDSLGLWLKMDDYTSYGGSPSDGQPMGRTSDSSGNGLVAELIKGNGAPTIVLPSGGRTGRADDGAFQLGVINYGNGGLLQVGDNDNLDNTSALTITLWWRPNSLVLNTDIFYRNGAYNLYSGSSPGRLAFSLAGNTGNDDHVLNTLFTTNRWYHLAFVFDGSRPIEKRVRAYVDGVLDFEGDEQTASLGNLSENLLIGRKPTGPRMDSRVDDFRIYRRALSAIEVGQIAKGVNLAPEPNAGNDTTATTTAALNLAGSVTDPDSSPVIAWSKVSGPGNVEFTAPGSAASQAWFSAAGVYVLRLTARDPDGATMADDVTVTVSGPVQPILQRIAVNGRIDVNPPQTRFENTTTTVTLTAIPDEGYEFSGWGGDLSGAANPAQLLMNSDKTVTAHFSRVEHALAVSAVNGAVLRDPDLTSYPAGSVVRLTAYPLAGHYFAGWSGDASGDAATTTVTVNGPMSVTAHFLAYRTLSVSSTNGAVLVTPEKTLYRQDETVSLTAVPATGYRFSGWRGDIQSAENPVAVLMATDISVTAEFMTGFAAWVEETLGAVSDPELRRASGDPDQDGIVNLLEYAFGLNPVQADPTTAVPKIVSMPAGADLYYGVEYERPTGGRADLTYRLETSTDLKSWQLETGMESVEPLANGRERVRLRTAAPFTGDRQFLRLRVSTVDE